MAGKSADNKKDEGVLGERQALAPALAKMVLPFIREERDTRREPGSYILAIFGRSRRAITIKVVRKLLQLKASSTTIRAVGSPYGAIGSPYGPLVIV